VLKLNLASQKSSQTPKPDANAKWNTVRPGKQKTGKIAFAPEPRRAMHIVLDPPKSKEIGSLIPIPQTTFRAKSGVAGDQNQCGQSNLVKITDK